MTETLYGIQHYVAEATAYAQGTEEDITAFGGTGKSAKEYAESIDPESLKVKTVFSINEASKDASGNPNFMSVSGNQITFNGAVKYTQANGESKEYASVSPIALTSGYVMLNNGVASVVPAFEVQQSEPTSPVAQTVWFNPYNNQAKQYNGTDWVDYNGVPVGTITDGAPYTYQYNSWKDKTPVQYSGMFDLNNLSTQAKEVIVNYCTPDYTRKISRGTNTGSFTTPFDCFVYASCNARTSFSSYISIVVDGVSIGDGSYGNNVLMSTQALVGKGSTVTIRAGENLGIREIWYCPLKGVE